MDEPDGREIWFLNRGLVLLRPKQPFIDWVRHSNPKSAEPVEDDLVRDGFEAFLIPPFEMTDDSHDWIRDNFELMFGIALDSWYTDPGLWPEPRDWETFNRWFDVKLIDVMWDLIDHPLSSEAP